MQDTSNRDKAIRLIQSVAAGEPAYELLAPYAMWWILGRSEYPARQFLEFVSTKQFPPGGKTDVIGVTAEGDRVAVEGRSLHRMEDGREYKNQYHFLVEFRDGLIVKVREYLDTAYANRFFGTDMFSQS